jgi:hypothetical protein
LQLCGGFLTFLRWARCLPSLTEMYRSSDLHDPKQNARKIFSREKWLSTREVEAIAANLHKDAPTALGKAFSKKGTLFLLS